MRKVFYFLTVSLIVFASCSDEITPLETTPDVNKLNEETYEVSFEGIDFDELSKGNGDTLKFETKARRIPKEGETNSLRVTWDDMEVVGSCLITKGTSFSIKSGSTIWAHGRYSGDIYKFTVSVPFDKNTKVSWDDEIPGTNGGWRVASSGIEQVLHQAVSNVNYTNDSGIRIYETGAYYLNYCGYTGGYQPVKNEFCGRYFPRHPNQIRLYYTIIKR